MTEKETELISIIRNHENPAQALLIATKILISVLTPNAKVAEPFPAALPKQF